MMSDEKPKARWFFRFVRRSLLLLLIVVAIGGWFLPQIVSQTSLKQTLLDRALGDAPGSITVDELSIAWNAPVRMTGLKIYDANASVILSAEELTTKKTLWSLVRSQSDLGEIHIKKPDGHLVVRAEGTNLGDALIAKTTTPQKPFAWSDIPNVKFILEEGSLSVEDTISQKQYQVTNLAVAFNKPDANSSPITCSASLNVAPSGKDISEAAGQLSFQAELNPPTLTQNQAGTQKTSQQGTLALDAKALPLALLQPTLQWLLPELSINAIAEVKSNLKFAIDQSGAIRIEGESDINAKQVVVQGEDWIGPYRIASETLTGKLQFAASDQLDDTQFDFTADLKNPEVFEVAQSPSAPVAQQAVQDRRIWNDNAARIVGQGTYNGIQDDLKITQGQVQSSSLVATVQGTLQQVSTDILANIQGTLQTAPQQTDALIASIIADENIKLKGVQVSKFAVKGPLRFSNATGSNTLQLPTPEKQSVSQSSQSWVPKNLTAQMQLDWKQAEAYGMELKPGSFFTQLDQGILQITPHQVGIGNRGQLLAAPRIDLRSPAMSVTLPKGGVLKEVHMNEAMARQWLKFVAPFLADATSVNGVMSIDLDQDAIVPLNDFTQLEAAGNLTFHTAQIGPGPSFNRITGIVGTVRQLTGKGGLANALRPNARWIQMNNRKVQVMATKGRMYHKDMVYDVSGVAVQTSGSVGMKDQTIDMTASVILPDKMIAGKPWLKDLQGDGLRVRITGTVQKPIIDSRGIAALGKKFGAAALSRKLGTDLLKKQLGGDSDKEVDTAADLIFDLIKRRKKKK